MALLTHCTVLPDGTHVSIHHPRGYQEVCIGSKRATAEDMSQLTKRERRIARRWLKDLHHTSDTFIPVVGQLADRYQKTLLLSLQEVLNEAAMKQLGMKIEFISPPAGIRMFAAERQTPNGLAWEYYLEIAAVDRPMP